MASWNVRIPAGQFAYDSKSLKKKWGRLHVCDQEALPDMPQLLDAWAQFHNGQFEAAYQQGCQLGALGSTVANRAVCIYTGLMAPQANERQVLCLAAAARAEQQLDREPDNANAHYLLASALGRYSQGLSVAKGLAQGLGGRIKTALENAIALQPLHADAHFALGTFHADIIDKVGELIGNMAFGARRDASKQMFQKGFALLPHSPSGLVEYATALLMLEGDPGRVEAAKLCAQAAKLQAEDAREYLDIVVAQRGLPD